MTLPLAIFILTFFFALSSIFLFVKCNSNIKLEQFTEALMQASFKNKKDLCLIQDSNIDEDLVPKEVISNFATKLFTTETISNFKEEYCKGYIILSDNFRGIQRLFSLKNFRPNRRVLVIFGGQANFYSPNFDSPNFHTGPNFYTGPNFNAEIFLHSTNLLGLDILVALGYVFDKKKSSSLLEVMPGNTTLQVLSIRDNKVLVTWKLENNFTMAKNGSTIDEKRFELKPWYPKFRKGEAFKASMFNCTPFIIQNSKNKIADGIEYRMLKEITQNWPLDFIVHVQNDSQSVWAKNVLSVHKGDCHAALCSIFQYFAFESHIDMSYPYAQTCVTFLVPKPKLLPQSTYVFQPFQIPMWALCFISMVVIAGVLNLFAFFEVNSYSTIKETSGDFHSVKLRPTKHQSMSLQSVNHQPVNLQSVNLQPVNLQPENLQPIDLQSTNLQPTNLQLTNLQPTNIYPTNLQPTNLYPTNFQSANLPPTHLQPTHLQPTHLQPANLQKPMNFKDFGECFIIVFRSFTAGGYDKFPPPIQYLFRYILTVWLVGNVIISTGYSAGFTSSLTSPRYTKPINHLEDMVDQKIVWGVPEIDSRDNMAKSENEALVAISKKFMLEVHPTDRNRRIRRGNYAIMAKILPENYITDTESLDGYGKTHLKIILDCVGVHHLVIGMEMHSPFKDIFDRKIMRFVEGGLANHWYGLIKSKFSVELDNFFSTYVEVTNRYYALRLTQIQGCFYALIIGLVMSFFAFLGEWAYHRFYGKGRKEIVF